jgi:hypothetical protein
VTIPTTALDWLDSLIYGVRHVQIAGAPTSDRTTINIIGGTVADNPGQNRIDITIPATVTAVTATAPIVSSGGSAPVISISPATGGSAGSMSAADKTKLDASTASATNSTLAQRDGAARIAFSGVDLDATPATAGTVRVGNASTAKYRNAANSANNALWAVDGADGISFGDASAASISSGVKTGGSFSWAINAAAVMTLTAASLQFASAVNIQCGGATKIALTTVDQTIGDTSVAAGSLFLQCGGSGVVRTKVGGATIITAASSLVTLTTGLALAGNVTFDVAQASPTIQQTAATSDVACADLIIASQAAFATATGANRVGGNVVIALPAPTNSGTTSPAVKVKEGATSYAAFGHYQPGTAYGCYWGGSATPSISNFAFLGDGSTIAYFNAPSGGTLNLSFAGTSANGISMTASLLTSIIPAWQFAVGVASPTINQADNVTNAATAQTLKIQAANATGTTSTGGGVDVTSGTGTTTAGNVRIQTGGTTRLSVQPSLVQILAGQLQQVKNAPAFAGTMTVDFATGNVQEITLTANLTSLSFSNMKSGAEYVLVFIQDGTGSRLLTLPAAMKPAGGTFTLTTTAGKRDVFRCYSDGTNLYECGKNV